MSMQDAAQARTARYNARKQAAATITAQLGGNKFLAMTGAKRLTVLEEQRGGLGFQLPVDFAADGINWVEVILQGDDLYTVNLYSVRPMVLGKALVKGCDSLDVEQMVSFFQDATGLYLSL